MCDTSEFSSYGGLMTRMFGEKNCFLKKHGFFHQYISSQDKKKKCAWWKDGMGERKCFLYVANLLEVKR